MKRTSWLLTALLIAAPPIVRAEGVYPMVMSVRPVAIQAGTTAEHTVRARYAMEGAYRVLISGAGVDADQNVWSIAYSGSVATRVKVDAQGNMTPPDITSNPVNQGCPAGGGSTVP